jgi:hypothetical protein
LAVRLWVGRFYINQCPAWKWKQSENLFRRFFVHAQLNFCFNFAYRTFGSFIRVENLSKYKTFFPIHVLHEAPTVVKHIFNNKPEVCEGTIFYFTTIFIKSFHGKMCKQNICTLRMKFECESTFCDVIDVAMKYFSSKKFKFSYILALHEFLSSWKSDVKVS